MPMKSCSHCGIVPMNHKCPVIAKEQHDRDSKREDKKIYWSVKWRKLRVVVLEEQEYVCLWSLYVDGVIRQASCVHHIVELIVDDSKAYDRDNVIGLDKSVHDVVHELYKIDRVNTMKILRECNRLWLEGVRLEGMGMLKSEVNKING
ncbi:hypothetical protein [Clostridium sp. FP1]|uniref:hypothetical protein n=1 Tax=Clostridium sp. FP1 TaxID=2724076 RepID=UPI0013E93A1F|nr:hypothetical protein [Clostridium sp. FP1]MBZ9635509.1 hypothetical protein [Clostridium sp. FP1]